jgi:uncharacterized protein
VKRLMPAVLVDTGPLVALLDRSDPDHVACQETLSSLSDSMVTVWPVVTEAMYMLRAYWRAQEALWEMIEMGAVEILPLGPDDVPRMKELMRFFRATLTPARSFFGTISTPRLVLRS